MNLHPRNLMALKPYNLNSTLKMTFKDAGFNIHTFQTNDEGFSDFEASGIGYDRPDIH